MNLFINEFFHLHSGGTSNFKIECDALKAEDYTTLATIISKNISFSEVVGIPRGGLIFAEACKPYIKKGANTLLIVDDVFTTGGSMNEYKEKYKDPNKNIMGIVVFSRHPNPPKWIIPIFSLNPLFKDA